MTIGASKADELPDHLVLQLVPVDDDQDGGLLQIGVMPEFFRRKQDREALAAALRVPDEAAPPRLLAVEFQRPLDDFVGGGELLVTGHLLDRAALLNLENDEVPQEVEQVCPVEQAVDRALHPVHLRDVRVRPGVAPLLPGVELRPGDAVTEDQFVHRAAEGVRVVKLRSLARVTSALLGPQRPVNVPVPPGRLRLDVDEGDAVDEQQEVRTDVSIVRLPFVLRGGFLNAKLIRRQKIVALDVVVIHQPESLLRLIHGEFHRLFVAQPAEPLLVVPFDAQAGDDAVGPFVICDDLGVQGDEPLPEDGEQEDLALVHRPVRPAGAVFAQDGPSVLIAPAEFGRLEPVEDRVLDRAGLVGEFDRSHGDGIVRQSRSAILKRFPPNSVPGGNFPCREPMTRQYGRRPVLPPAEAGQNP